MTDTTTVGSIERLRAALPDEVEKPTLAQVRTVVNGLIANHSLDEIARDAFGPVLTVDDHLRVQVRTLDVVADFGTWLTHVNGGTGVETIQAVDQGQMTLFQTPALVKSTERPAAVKRGKKWIPFTDLSAVEQAAVLRLPEGQQQSILEIVEEHGEEAGKAKIEEIIVSRERRKAAAEKAKSTRAKARAAKLLAELEAVTIPVGFERKAFHKRDVAKALAAIVVTDPDDDTIARFIARKYQTQARVLTFPHVTQVWFFARLGRLDELDRVNPANHVFGELLVEAYDLLDVARQAAIDGINLLVQGDASDLDAIEAACQKASWVAEADIRRISKMVTLAKARSGSLRLLERELSFFAQRVRQSPGAYRPQEVADLNLGHINRIAAAAGLDVENDERADEIEVRQTLKNLGFTSDLDRLVPEGVRAVRAGKGDEFFEVMDQRRDGNTEWHLMLEELTKSISA